jgi:hypothetical protein
MVKSTGEIPPLSQKTRPSAFRSPAAKPNLAEDAKTLDLSDVEQEQTFQRP